MRRVAGPLHRLALALALAVATAARSQSPPPAKPSPEHRAASALATFACDDQCSVFLNGELVGEVTQWDFPLRVDIAREFYPLVIAVEARNQGGVGALLGVLEARAQSAVVERPAAWRCSAVQEASWNLPHFDDAHWPQPTVIAPYGSGVWGDRAGVGLEPGNWVWLDPPAVPEEAIFCRWRIESSPAPR